MKAKGSPFVGNSSNYHYGTLSSPYRVAGQSYDNIIGNQVYQAYCWRLGFILSMVLNSLLALGLILVLTKNPVTVMVAEITKSGYLVRYGQLEHPKLYRDFKSSTWTK